MCRVWSFQNENRASAAQNLFDSVEEDKNLLKMVIISNKLWVHDYDPKTKTQSLQWKTLTWLQMLRKIQENVIRQLLIIPPPLQKRISKKEMLSSFETMLDKVCEFKSGLFWRRLNITLGFWVLFYAKWEYWSFLFYNTSPNTFWSDPPYVFFHRFAKSKMTWKAFKSDIFSQNILLVL